MADPTTPRPGRLRAAVTVPVMAVVALLAPVLVTAPASAAPVSSAAATTALSAARAVPAARPLGLDPGLVLTGPARRVVVTGSGAGVPAAVQAAGGRVLAPLPLVDGVSAVVPAERLAALASAPAVRAVTADRRGRFVDYAWDETTTASTFAKTMQATSSWTAGNYGKGVGVAVLDTGVSPMADLEGRLVHGPDLSGEGTVVDSYGHGTVMAGLIAGNGAASASRAGGAYTGVAPAAHVVAVKVAGRNGVVDVSTVLQAMHWISAYREQYGIRVLNLSWGVAPAAHVVAVKVAGRNGVVDVSTVLQAMHWISAYREQYGIRVLNLSWGVASTQSPTVDPINHAVQRLWAQGIVVVVAAGNSGSGAGTITKPGDDPVVLTVGALNDEGDTDPANDSVPQWSSRGPTATGLSKPDLVAPGRTVIALRSPGSAIETNNGRALVSPAYIKGSGSSQAAAVTSGAVALLLAARPQLTPDQVKSVLTSSAAPLAGVSPYAQGKGRLQLQAALAATPSTSAQVVTGAGTGSLEASRGGMRVVATCDGVQVEIRGEIDVRCQPWDGARWSGTPWTGDAWTGVAWKGSEWTGVAWKGVGWSDASWTGVAWKGGTWTAGSWYGERSWTGDAAVTSPWTGVAWKDAGWTGVAWKDTGWTTGEWTGSSYDEFLSAFWGSTPPPGKRLRGEVYTPRSTG